MNKELGLIDGELSKGSDYFIKNSNSHVPYDLGSHLEGLKERRELMEPTNL